MKFALYGPEQPYYQAFLIPASSGVSEWASEQTNERSGARERSAEQANECAALANKRKDEWVVHNFGPNSWLFWAIVR